MKNIEFRTLEKEGRIYLQEEKHFLFLFRYWSTIQRWLDEDYWCDKIYSNKEEAEADIVNILAERNHKMVVLSQLSIPLL